MSPVDVVSDPGIGELAKWTTEPYAENMARMRGPRPWTPAEIEASLKEWGAEFREPPLPDQLLVWEPKQFVGAMAYLSEEQWWEGVIYFGGNCLKQTRPQTRAAIYETGEGIAGFWDFSGRAAKVKGARTRFMAAGVDRPLNQPIPRAQLTAEPDLHDRFKTMVARGALTEPQGRAILALASANNITIPEFVRFAP